MKTILVTGGAGFIGSNFIYLLQKERKEYRIVCVDYLTEAANTTTLDEAKQNENFVFYRENVCNREGIYRIFETEHPDIVVNFAAETHIQRSIANPTIFLETNILGAQVLLDACRKFGIERFHQVGTDEVYGSLSRERTGMLFTESTPVQPLSPYATSKAAVDMLAMAYYRTYELPVTVSRASMTYGPYQSADAIIPQYIINALNDKPLSVYGDGLNIRDWLYVKDHCSGILAVIEKGRTGETYNLGGYNEETYLEVVKAVLRETGKSENLITHLEDRRCLKRRYAGDPTKAENELGWATETDFDTGIKLTVDWYKNHTEWVNAAAMNG